MYDVINDQITPPTIEADELRHAMRVVSLHVGEIRYTDHSTLNRALAILNEAMRNENWIMYVP